MHRNFGLTLEKPIDNANIVNNNVNFLIKIYLI